jgi:hypothetical protein
MADWVSSLFVIVILLGYAALLIGLLVWMVHGWAGPRLKARSSRKLSSRLKFLRLLHRDQ